MKIGNSADTTGAAGAVSNTASAGKPASDTNAAAAKAADASAKVEFSHAASTLLHGASNAEFDAVKVARIAQSIEDGTFRIDPEAIADKLIANAQELLGATPR